MADAGAPRAAGGLHPTEDGLAAAALAATGGAAFRWSPAQAELVWAGAPDGLGLTLSGRGLGALLDALAEPDRAALARLVAAGTGEIALIARLAFSDGGARRALLRARWRSGAEPVLVGLVAPLSAGEDGDEGGRLGLAHALRDAVERADFVAWRQPIVRLADGALAGFEALIRWPAPERGLLPPDDFLPLAQELGLSGRLGRWMRAEAAAQLALWRTRWGEGAPGFLAVNVTSAELAEPGLVEETATLIAARGLAAGALKLEITEDQVMGDPDRAASVLAELRQAGASLALDDFGAGYSSLTWLERLPVDTVKIDRHFARTLTVSAASRAILASVVALAHELGRDVVAEGVETAEAAAALGHLGCDFAQGYWFAPPLTAAEADHLLASGGLAAWRGRG